MRAVERPVLLIEDSDDEVAVTLLALQRAGLTAPTVVLRDGAEAIDYLHALEEAGADAPTPAAIFLDLRMPRVDGKQVLKEVRRMPRTQNVPVIVVSSTQRSDEVEECYRLGANSFISKRFGESSPGTYMVNAIRYWLELNAPPESDE